VERRPPVADAIHPADAISLVASCSKIQSRLSGGGAGDELAGEVEQVVAAMATTLKALAAHATGA